MSKFEYMAVSEDVFGHVVYKCKCAECGAECEYLRKISTAPLCESCKQRKHNQDMLNRERMRFFNELVKSVKGYYKVYDKMPSMKVFEELADAVLVNGNEG